MPSPPYAQVLVSLNGGAPSSGVVQVHAGDVVQLQMGNTSGVRTQRWELFDYPIGWSAPSGWTDDGTGLLYSTDITPAAFTIPAQSNDNWGKVAIRLRLNGNPLQFNDQSQLNQGFVAQLTDESVQLDYRSALGLEGICVGDVGQADRLRKWAGTLMRFERGLIIGATGFVAGTDLASIDTTHQKVIGIATLPIDLTTTSAVVQGAVFVGNTTSNKNEYRRLTEDDVDPGFTIAISGSGNGLFEIGATWTTTSVAVSPVPTTSGLTAMVIHDSDGGSSNILGHTSPVATPSATYSKSTPGQTETITVTGTKGGISKTSNSLISTWAPRLFYGFGSNAVPTAMTASGGNAVLTGPTASLTGIVSNGLGINNQNLIGSITPASNWFWIAWNQVYGSTHTLFDALSTFQIDMFATVYSLSFTTQTGVTTSYYAQRSTNDLGTHPIQPYFTA